MGIINKLKKLCMPGKLRCCSLDNKDSSTDKKVDSLTDDKKQVDSYSEDKKDSSLDNKD